MAVRLPVDSPPGGRIILHGRVKSLMMPHRLADQTAFLLAGLEHQMALKHLKKRSEIVQLPDGESFTVHGLGMVDIMALALQNGRELAASFDKVKELCGQGDLTAAFDASPTGVFNACARVPDLLIQIIGLGAREEDLALVRDLPIGAQIEALEKIVNLTFASYSPDAIIKTISRVMRQLAEPIMNSTTSKPVFHAQFR